MNENFGSFPFKKGRQTKVGGNIGSHTHIYLYSQRITVIPALSRHFSYQGQA